MLIANGPKNLTEETTTTTPTTTMGASSSKEDNKNSGDVNNLYEHGGVHFFDMNSVGGGSAALFFGLGLIVALLGMCCCWKARARCRRTEARSVSRAIEMAEMKAAVRRSESPSVPTSYSPYHAVHPMSHPAIQYHPAGAISASASAGDLQRSGTIAIQGLSTNA